MGKAALATSKRQISQINLLDITLKPWQEEMLRHMGNTCKKSYLGTRGKMWRGKVMVPGIY